MDQGVGRILDALDRHGLAPNTLVINTTDHGIAFPLMKCNLEDNGWGVSLIMRGPGGFQGGGVSDALISQVDLFPTICEVAAIDKPSWLTGRSILPVVRGEAEEINEAVFAEVNYHAAYEPKRAVRTKRWKYIRRHGDQHTPVLPNCDDGLSKTLWVQNGWKQQVLPGESLYDCSSTPPNIEIWFWMARQNPRSNRCADASIRGCGPPMIRCSAGRLGRRTARKSTIPRDCRPRSLQRRSNNSR
jgi:N-sulfoglucosamine sulfohydrolase